MVAYHASPSAEYDGHGVRLRGVYDLDGNGVDEAVEEYEMGSGVRTIYREVYSMTKGQLVRKSQKQLGEYHYDGKKSTYVPNESP